MLAASVGVQPAAELRHLQRHEHGLHVLGALRACPSPPALSRALPVHAVCVAVTQRPHAPRAAPLPASHARLSTRQRASAFNQALSFDRSKVTDMQYMFYVRSARALAPSLESGPPRACRLRRRRPTPCRLPARTSLRVACPPFDSAECGGVQPAAEPRHVQRHDHGLHVLRALRACPGPTA